jgi:hypothetical protein
MGSGLQYESSFDARRSLNDLGVAPGQMVVRDSCLNVAALVWEGSVEAGVVSDYCVDHSGLQLVDDPDAFRVLGTTAGIPFITFAVADSVASGVRAELAGSLQRMTVGRVPADLHSPGLIAAIPWSPPELEHS